MKSTTSPTPKLLRYSAVMDRLSVSKSTLCKLLKSAALERRLLHVPGGKRKLRRITEESVTRYEKGAEVIAPASIKPIESPAAAGQEGRAAAGRSARRPRLADATRHFA